MVVRQYDYNYQYKFYTPPPPDLKRKKTKQSNNGPFTFFRNFNSNTTKPKQLSQSDQNWFRRGERARRFSIRKGKDVSSTSKSSNYVVSYMNSGNFQYNPFGYMSDAEIKRNRANSEDHSTVVVDCIEMEDPHIPHDDYTIESDHWDESEDEFKRDCFHLLRPILLRYRGFKKMRAENQACSTSAAQSKLSEYVDRIEELYLKKTAEQRISRALLVLRAESRRRHEDEERQSQEENYGTAIAVSPGERRSSLKDLTGPVGLALFSPLDPESFETETTIEDSREENEEENDSESVSSNSTNPPEQLPHVNLDPEPSSTLDSSPYILSMDQMQEINQHLPATVQIMNWERAYSVSRDGDLFTTMLNKVESYRYTLLVIKTDRGEILGGFADNIWLDDTRNTSKRFFGSGLGFLFHFVKAEKKEKNTEVGGELEVVIEEDEQEDVSKLDKEQATTEEEIKSENNDFPKEQQDIVQTEKKQGTNDQEEKVKEEGEDLELKVYKWTGLNTYSQLCDIQKGKLAMGGGGEFGIAVGEWFSRGSTGKCDTFGNPPLVKDENFDIWEFEMYGFTPAGF